jgi:hypothetical protein
MLAYQLQQLTPQQHLSYQSRLPTSFDTNEVLDDLGITFVDKVPVVSDQDDDLDTSQGVDEFSRENEEDDNNNGNIYARKLPVPSMESHLFRQPALDTVFWECLKTYTTHRTRETSGTDGSARSNHQTNQ